jgi:hypothetical protein
MTQIATMPKMLWTPTGFYCTYCDYYFFPELDRSGLPDSPVKWVGLHGDEQDTHREATATCPLVGKMFEIDITQVFPEAGEVGKR